MTFRLDFGIQFVFRISLREKNEEKEKHCGARESAVMVVVVYCFFLSLLLSDFVQFGKNAQIRCIFFIGLASHFKLKVANYWINTAGTQNAACCFSG